MRLWHKDLIPYLPKSQLLAQWRELNSIYKKQDKHLLINYNYEYSKEHLYTYSMLVIKEMTKRGYKIRKDDNLCNYFYDYLDVEMENFLNNLPIKKLHFEDIFINHHNEDYLVKCYYNLKEKFDCGQKYFSEVEWLAIEKKFGKRVLAEVQRQLGEKR